MSGRGKEHNPKARSSSSQRREVEGSLLNFANWLMWEATNIPSSSHPPLDQQFDSKSYILEQVDTYTEEDVDILKEVDRSQSEESEQEGEEKLRPHQSPTMRVLPPVEPLSSVSIGFYASQ